MSCVLFTLLHMYVKYYNVDISVVKSAFILVDKCSPIIPSYDVFIIYNFGKAICDVCLQNRK